MKFYIAAKDQATAQGYKTILEQLGHTVTAQWITKDVNYGKNFNYSDTERATLALMDEQDVRASTGLILIAEPVGQMTPGGKHVELGIALALGLPIYVVGRRENIFHWHPLVTVVDTFQDLLNVLHTAT